LVTFEKEHGVNKMKKFFFPLATAALLALPMTANAQRGGGCQQLRQACLQRERLGERGEGNCARYRAVCRGQVDRGYGDGYGGGGYGGPQIRIQPGFGGHGHRGW